MSNSYFFRYTIARKKSDTLAEVLGSSPQNVSFRRDLIGARLASWQALQQRLAGIQLTPGHDEFRWSLLRIRNSRWILYIKH